MLRPARGSLYYKSITARLGVCGCQLSWTTEKKKKKKKKRVDKNDDYGDDDGSCCCCFFSLIEFVEAKSARMM